MNRAWASGVALALGVAVAGGGASVPAVAQKSSPPAPAASSPITNPDLAQVARHLIAVQTMVSAFTQTDRRGRITRGTVTISRPGKIRFQYQKGIPILIVGDGSSLYFIDYSVRQVSRWPIGNSPLTALLEPARGLARVARVLPQINPDRVIVEAKDPKRPEYGVVTLIFVRDPAGPAGLTLTGWTARDAQGNLTRIALNAPRYNVALPSGVFRWQDPRPQSPRAR